MGLGAREKKQQLEEALPGPTDYLDESLRSRCQVPCHPVGPSALPSPPHSRSVPHKNKGPAGGTVTSNHSDTAQPASRRHTMNK